MKNALLFGATGFVGSHLLGELLGNPTYDRVTVVVRRPLSNVHPKLNVVIGDFSSLPSLRNDIVADDVFLTLGTTRKSTPNSEEYYQVDHDYPVLAARIAKENGATSVFVVTSVGANVQSRSVYLRTKGELERDIIALGYEHTHIFRPSMITGSRDEHRSNETLLIAAWSVASAFLIGPLSRYKGMDGKDIAAAMNQASMKPAKTVTIYHWAEMRALLVPV
ncbi:MAG TPA: NAD(P)H-binding protein [Gemmatimonadaceae bacterium]|jgi:uncharacterized protein YbjT (DUF2867 family)